MLHLSLNLTVYSVGIVFDWYHQKVSQNKVNSVLSIEPLLSSTNQSADEDDSESQYGHSDNENCTLPQELDVKTDKQMSETSFSPINKQEAMEINKVD